MTLFPTDTQLRLLIQKITLQSKAGHPQTGYADTLVWSCDLDLDPMTLLDLNIPKMYLHTKNDLSRTRLSKVITDRCTRRSSVVDSWSSSWTLL